MKKIILALIVLFPSVLSAQALPAAVPVDSISESAKGIVESIGDGQVLLGVMLSIILAVTVIRKVSKRVKALSFFTTKMGGYCLTYGGSVAAAIAAAKQAGMAINLGLLSSAVAAGFAASGGWEALSDAIAWATEKLKKPTEIKEG